MNEFVLAFVYHVSMTIIVMVILAATTPRYPDGDA